MTHPRAFRLSLPEVAIQVYEWPGEGRPVLFAHATGFHARCWDGVVRHLPGVHCYAIDMRGHGLSDKPALPYPWTQFGDDVARVARELGLHGAIGIGHSKGGHAMVVAAAAVPDAFAALLLVDPVIMAPERYREAAQAGEGGELHFASRRRNEWSSPEEMYERFRERPFSTWQPDVLMDYCRYGLVPAPTGPGFVLACPPEIEAAVYAGSAGADPSAAVTALDIPVRVLRARNRTQEVARDFSSSPTDPALAARFKRGEDVYLEQHTHFIPMEAPELVASHVRQLIETVNAAGG